MNIADYIVVGALIAVSFGPGQWLCTKLDNIRQRRCPRLTMAAGSGGQV